MYTNTIVFIRPPSIPQDFNETKERSKKSSFFTSYD